MASEPSLLNETNNYTLRGCTSGYFAFCVAWLSARKLLWSCVLDKYGDWLISTEDDTPGEQILDLLAAASTQFQIAPIMLNIDVVRYGELITTLESVEEYNRVAEMEDAIESDDFYPDVVARQTPT